jgi:hypothetical protein
LLSEIQSYLSVNSILSSLNYQVIAGCSRSKATRPTLAPQTSPKIRVLPEKDGLHHETVHGLITFPLPSFDLVLNGEDGW